MRDTGGRILEQRERARDALGTVTVLELLVFTVLALSSQQLIATATALDDVQAVTQAWAGADYDVLAIDVRGERVEVVLTGPSEPSDVDALAARVADDPATDVDLTAGWVPRTALRASTQRSTLRRRGRPATTRRSIEPLITTP